MDEEIERLVVSVRADTAGFARDVDTLRANLEGPLSAGADRAGRSIENALVRAVRSGKLGFEDLGRTAMAVLSDVAAGAVRTGIDAIAGGGSAGGLGQALAALLGGAPGRATGGPVSPGRAYTVGERGPELFVPTTSGRIETGQAAPVAAAPMQVATMQPAMTRAPIAGAATPPPRDVRVSITVNAARGEAPDALARSSRQVARAVRSALAGAD